MKKAVIITILSLFKVLILTSPASVIAEKTKTAPSSSITIRLNQATSLMNKGKAHEAFDLLAPLEYALAGNTDYDYLFGIAALESGRPVKASLALERVLTIKPDFAGARIELGRAYFEIGNYLRARHEFTTVLKHPNPPPPVTDVISKYMVMIENRLAKKKTRMSGWVEVSVGYDSNVNYSTDDAVIPVPVFQGGQIILSDDNIEQDDTYVKFSVNMDLLHHFSPSARTYVGLFGSKRLLSDESQFETEDAQLRTYLELGESINIFRIGAIAGLSTLDEPVNSHQVGGNMEWQHTLNPSNLITLFSQYDTFRYPDVKVNNYDQWIGGMSWRHYMSFLGKSIVAANAYGGYAFETNGRADGDNSIYGLSLGYQMTPVPAVSIFAGIDEMFSDFKNENVYFLEKRDDQQLDARLGLVWSPVNNVSVGGVVSYTHNNSSIPIHEYKRTDVSAMLRYHFL